MPSPVADAVALALAELNRAIAPQQRVAVELRKLSKLKFSPADEKRLADALSHLTVTITAVADECAGLDDVVATLRRARGGRQ